ncbi:MAG: site-specific DNA-methyltransferase [Promethearchaeota archaeon]
MTRKRNNTIELIWDGKLIRNDEYSREEVKSIKFKIDIHGHPLDLGKRAESIADHEKINDNSLYLGDNLLLMQYLLEQGLKEKIDLIYIDPPFFTRSDFTIALSNGKRTRSYNDTWQNGLAQYLQYMYPRLKLMHELLKKTGSIYIHLDWHVVHYIKLLMDEIFGYENFKNQIIWKRLTYKQTQVKGYGVLHDVILYYTKSNEYVWNDVRAKYSPEKLKKYFNWIETPDGKNIKLSREYFQGQKPIPKGRRFALNPLINPNPNRPNLTYEFLGFKKVWKYTREKMQDYYEKGIVFQPSPGVMPKKKQYLDESRGMKLNDIFLDISGVMGVSKERVGFDTQKPEKLLRRLISVSSNPGDLVADFFCGSGTTISVARKMARRWIGCDISRLAIQTCVKRLLNDEYLNLGNGKPYIDGGKKLLFQVKELVYPKSDYLLSNPGRFKKLILNLQGAKPQEKDDLIHGLVDGIPIHVVHPAVRVDTSWINRTAEKCNEKSMDEIKVVVNKWYLSVNDDLEKITRNLDVKIHFVNAPKINDLLAQLTGFNLKVDDIIKGDFPVTFLKKLDLFHPEPNIMVDIKERDDGLNIRLKTYFMLDKSFKNVNHSLEDGVKFKNLDYWAISFNRKKGGFPLFYHDWFSFNNFNNKKQVKLNPHASFTMKTSKISDISFKFVDINGHSTFRYWTRENLSSRRKS